jgi:DNA-directed RNA polymerase subunit RPC12/RpoP
MQRDVTIRLKFFRSILVVGFIVNGAALFFYRPFVSYLVVLLTLTWIASCIRCANCGKSPYVKQVGSSRIGIPVPELRCSKCGREFRADEPGTIESGGYKNDSQS